MTSQWPWEFGGWMPLHYSLHSQGLMFDTYWAIVATVKLVGGSRFWFQLLTRFYCSTMPFSPFPVLFIPLFFIYCFILLCLLSFSLLSAFTLKIFFLRFFSKLEYLSVQLFPFTIYHFQLLLFFHDSMFFTCFVINSYFYSYFLFLFFLLLPYMGICSPSVHVLCLPSPLTSVSCFISLFFALSRWFLPPAQSLAT